MDRCRSPQTMFLPLLLVGLAIHTRMDVFESIVSVCVDIKTFDFGEWDVVAGVPPQEVVAEQITNARM